MNKIILLLWLCILCSCHTYDNSKSNKELFLSRDKEPSFTITVEHQECTGCLDVYISEGHIIVPDDMLNYLGDTLQHTDLNLVGHFPFDLINPQNFFFDSKLKIRITGKIIGVDSSTASDNYYSPIFYVEEWHKQK